MQLKEGSNEWFAPNMVKQYPSLAARYIYLDDTGLKGKWVLDAIREPKKHNKTGIIPCTYDWKTKLLTSITLKKALKKQAWSLKTEILPLYPLCYTMLNKRII